MSTALAPLVQESHIDTLANGIVERYSTLTVKNITVSAQGYYSVLEEDEDGELIGFEVACTSSHFIPEVKVHQSGINANPLTINDLTFTEMLKRGRGMTPGDAGTLSNGQSRDPTGTPSPVFPFLTRYKDETLIDYLGLEERYYACRYEPVVRPKYKSISFIMKNISTTDDAEIKDIIIFRKVYFSARDLAAQEASSSIDGEPTDIEDIDEDIAADTAGTPAPDQRAPNFDYDFNPGLTTEVNEDEIVDEGLIVENDGEG